MKNIIKVIILTVLVTTLMGCDSTEIREPSQSDLEDDIVTKTEKKLGFKTKTIEKGTTLVFKDYCEVTLKEAEFTKLIEPKKTDSFYTYYEVKEPNTIYLDVIIDIKSLLESVKVSDGFVSVQVKYKNKYEYNTFSIIEEKDGADFTYSNITGIEPLKSGRLHFIAELPEEASKDDGRVSVIISANDKEYEYIVK